MSAAMNKKQFLLTQHACPEGLSQDVFDAIREFCWLVALGQAERAETNLTSFLDDFEADRYISEDHAIYFGIKNIPDFFTSDYSDVDFAAKRMHKRLRELGVSKLDGYTHRFFDEDGDLLQEFYDHDFLMLLLAEELQDILEGFEYKEGHDTDEDDNGLDVWFWGNPDMLSYFLVKVSDRDRLENLINVMGCGSDSAQQVAPIEYFPVDD
jgi:hypothetical protein